MNPSKETKYNKLIVALSIIIPGVVALLFGVNLRKLGYDVQPLSFLPPIYASINGLTAIFLIFAVIATKNGKRKLHENLMKTAIACSVAFCSLYGGHKPSRHKFIPVYRYMPPWADPITVINFGVRDRRHKL